MNRMMSLEHSRFMNKFPDYQKCLVEALKKECYQTPELCNDCGLCGKEEAA